MMGRLKKLYRASNSLTFATIWFVIAKLMKPRPKTWHDMTQVDKVQVFAHHIIHFENLAEDNEQSSSSELIYKASNSLTFATIWLQSSGKLLTSQGTKHGMTWPCHSHVSGILCHIGRSIHSCDIM
jgi:hypothetical protein